MVAKIGVEKAEDELISRVRDEGGGTTGFAAALPKMLAGVAVDMVFDSVSVHTTFRDKLAEAGVRNTYNCRVPHTWKRPQKSLYF